MEKQTKKLTLTKQKVKDLKADIENRKEYIGGSDIGTIMGENPWKSAYTLWAEKAGLIEPEDISDVEAVWWGTHLEDLVAERFTMKTGLRVVRSNFAYGIEEYPFLRGHIDRRSQKDEFGLECKTTSSWNKTNYEEGEIPPMHWWQCQFYMAVTGIKVWYLATKRDSQFFVTKIDRDDEAIERMLDACQDFWNHVQNGEPVEIDESESTTETLEKMYPEGLANDTVDLSSAEDTLDALQACSIQKKNIDQIANGYRNEIKALLQEKNRGESKSYVVTWKTTAKGVRQFRVTEKKG